MREWVVMHVRRWRNSEALSAMIRIIARCYTSNCYAICVPSQSRALLLMQIRSCTGVGQIHKELLQVATGSNHLAVRTASGMQGNAEWMEKNVYEALPRMLFRTRSRASNLQPP